MTARKPYHHPDRVAARAERERRDRVLDEALTDARRREGIAETVARAHAARRKRLGDLLWPEGERADAEVLAFTFAEAPIPWQKAAIREALARWAPPLLRGLARHVHQLADAKARRG